MTWNEKMALEYIEARDLLRGRIKDIKKEIRKLQDEGIEVGGESYAEIARLNDKINMLSAIVRDKNEDTRTLGILPKFIKTADGMTNFELY